MKILKIEELRTYSIEELIKLIVGLQEENELLKAELARAKKSRASLR